MARQFVRSYTSDHQVTDDGSVAFACSQDEAEWAWLMLGPRHPVTIQSQNFWCSVGASLALGGLEEGQWSALTWTDWTCGDDAAGIAVRGNYRREGDDDKDSFRIELFDSDDRSIATMRGRGVVFRNRDFEGWRAKAKARVASERMDPADFAYGAREDLGLGDGEHPLIGEETNSAFPALITRDNGLPPANRMISGSGDHVNSVHMIEAARQALCLMRGDPQARIAGGEMKLANYVELDVPFQLAVVQDDEREVLFALEQAGRACAEFALRPA